MRSRKFLKLPEYPGGKEEFRKYLQSNLKYPDDALKNKIEGVVHLSAEINDNGLVSDIHIEKGIGYGCDQEAVRLVEGIHFGSVKNRGIRVKTRKRFRIPFKLPRKPIVSNLSNKGSRSIKYNLKKAGETDTKTANTVSYTYTVTIPKS